MQQIEVEVQPDFLDRLASGRPVQALAELIWNAFDAEATDVRVEFDRDASRRPLPIACQLQRLLAAPIHMISATSPESVMRRPWSMPTGSPEQPAGLYALSPSCK
jgi:hypothetical protein